MRKSLIALSAVAVGALFFSGMGTSTAEAGHRAYAPVHSAHRYYHGHHHHHGRYHYPPVYRRPYVPPYCPPGRVVPPRYGHHYGVYPRSGFSVYSPGLYFSISR